MRKLIAALAVGVLFLGCTPTVKVDYVQALKNASSQRANMAGGVNVTPQDEKDEALFKEIALNGADQWGQILNDPDIPDVFKDLLVEKIYHTRLSASQEYYQNQDYNEYLYTAMYHKRFEIDKTPHGFMLMETSPDVNNSLTAMCAYPIYSESMDKEIIKVVRVTFSIKDGRYVDEEEDLPTEDGIDIETSKAQYLTEQGSLAIDLPGGYTETLRISGNAPYCLCHSWYNIEIRRGDTVVWDAPGLICGDVQPVLHDFNGDGVKEIFLYYKAEDTTGFLILQRDTGKETIGIVWNWMSAVEQGKKSGMLTKYSPTAGLEPRYSDLEYWRKKVQELKAQGYKGQWVALNKKEGGIDYVLCYPTLKEGYGDPIWLIYVKGDLKIDRLFEAD